jgi:MYXO-CTERM domain-containing protein
LRLAALGVIVGHRWPAKTPTTPPYAALIGMAPKEEAVMITPARPLILAAVACAALSLNTAPALACDVAPRCAITPVDQSQIQCTFIEIIQDGCELRMLNTCDVNPAVVFYNGERILFPLDRTQYASIYVGNNPTATLDWTYGERSGQVKFTIEHIPYAEDPCGDGPFCAMTPASRPASGAGLLMAALGLVVGWRQRR